MLINRENRAGKRRKPEDRGLVCKFFDVLDV